MLNCFFSISLCASADIHQLKTCAFLLPFIIFSPFIILQGRIAQSVACLTDEPEIPGSIPSHILSFSLPLIQEGQLSVTGESMCP